MDGKTNNYDVMVSGNKLKAASKENYAIEAINDLLERGEQVTVKTLVEVTGFSRALFYNNEKVAEQLAKAKEKQKGKSFNYPQMVVLNKALEKDNELLKQIIKKQKAENDKLKRENEVLKKQIIELT